MLLAWDTETTGFPKDNLPPGHSSQPHLVQLGCALYDDSQNEVSYVSLIVRPDGWSIPDEVAKIHGTTTEIATAAGLPLIVVMSVFNWMVKISTIHLGHNVQFDEKIIRTAYSRVERTIPPLNLVCSQQMADAVMKLPPSQRMVDTGYGHKTKPPRLEEAVKFLFNEPLPGAHDALVDARASARVYFELLKRGVSGV